jgi:hypothetical protein
MFSSPMPCSATLAYPVNGHDRGRGAALVFRFELRYFNDIGAGARDLQRVASRAQALQKSFTHLETTSSLPRTSAYRVQHVV